MHCVCVWACCLGDISFRFLNYTRSVRERQLRQRARANQTPSWKDISGSYSSEGAKLPESRAVVCDINKEMLKVGKERAEKAGITTGTFHLDRCMKLNVCRVFFNRLNHINIRLTICFTICWFRVRYSHHILIKTKMKKT